ncbi:hypothetical protein FraQA3DRAFT_1587 [Frankia sp. QA3]|nr:hypothetical protein FraQA3DRAFT_1587 [Frankia sp. QA3]
MSAASLLSIIARIHPQVWEGILPTGPRVQARTDLVSLNPQPLPPGPPPDAFQIAAVAMAHDVVRLAVESDVRGKSSVGFLQEWVDDWCATPWPRKWPWPWPGPRPGDGPLPDPWVVQTGRVIGAIALASVGSRLAEGELGAACLEGAERLAEAAVSG